MQNSFLIFIKGFLMGITEVVPGVSASTLALVMKIYFNFINFLYQVSNFFKEIILFLIFKSSFKKLKEVFKEIDLTFGLPLFLGMLMAILTFSNIMSFLFEEHRSFVLAFFFGLVLASVSVPWASIEKKTFREYALLVLTFLFVFLALSLDPLAIEQAPSPLYFFIGGAVAICAMVLPGISGSFVFLMLGLYEFIVNYIRNFTRLEFESSEVISIVAVFFGIVLGFSLFVRLLRHALENHSSTILAVLTGIILASLRVLWPYHGVDLVFDFVVLTLIAGVGFGVVFFLKKLG